MAARRALWDGTAALLRERHGEVAPMAPARQVAQVA
jgi:hypothetical protein